jgi:uncharacterized protein (TIGR03437 family)
MPIPFRAVVFGTAMFFAPVVWGQLPKAYLIDSALGPPKPTAGSGNALTELYLMWPGGLALDASGNVYVSDQSFHRVLRITPDGRFTTFAGTSGYGNPQSGVPATQSGLGEPSGLAFDRAGNLYIADKFNSRIVKVSPSGILTRVAGGGPAGNTRDGLPPLDTQLVNPDALTVDSAGNIFFAERARYRVRKVPANGGPIETVAGTGVLGSSGDGGPAKQAQLEMVVVLHADASGNLWILDDAGFKVRKLTPDGILRTVISGLDPPLQTPLRGYRPLWAQGMATDSSGTVYLTMGGQSPSILKCPGATNCSIVAGGGGSPTSPVLAGTSQDGTATQRRLSGEPTQGVLDAAGNYYFLDGQRIRKLTPAGQLVTIGGSLDPRLAGHGQASSAVLIRFPMRVAAAPDGSVYFSDYKGHRIWKVAPTGVATVLAGTGTAGFSGDGWPAIQADIWNPTMVAVDGQGNVYFLDEENNVVRRVSPSGTITTVTGMPPGSDTSGCPVNPVSGTPSASACWWFPDDITVDASGALFVVNTGIWKVVPGGVITKLEGTLNDMQSVAVDKDGRVFAATANKIYRGGIGEGPFTHIAGTGATGPSGDGGPALSAALTVGDFAFDRNGILFITSNDRVRAITADGKIQTIAGGGQTRGVAAAGGPATSYGGYPQGVAAGVNGKLHLTDSWLLQSNYNSMGAWTLEPAQIFRTSVVNAASYQGGGVAPGEMVTVFGLDIGPGTLAPYRLVGNQFQAEVAGTRVLFNGIPAPIIYASSGADAAVVPYGVASSAEAEIWVEVNGVATNKVRLPVLPTMPGVFTTAQNGRGQAALLHWPDYSTNGPSNLLRKGGVGMLYLTAGGESGRDGWIVGGAEVHPMPVTVKVGGVMAAVSYSGPAPGLIYGMMQINFTVPPDAPSGAQVPLEVTVGTRAAQSGITIAIQ